MIDYGSLPMANGQLPNRDPESGIRYGLARQHDLADWIFSECEYDYAFGCPHCGEEMDPETEQLLCYNCEKPVDPDDCWSEEPTRCYIDDKAEGVYIEIAPAGFGVWIFKSPVITTGQHASPCAPGAVTINREPEPDGVKCYGLPAEWWAEEIA